MRNKFVCYSSLSIACGSSQALEPTQLTEMRGPKYGTEDNA